MNDRCRTGQQKSHQRRKSVWYAAETGRWKWVRRPLLRQRASGWERIKGRWLRRQANVRFASSETVVGLMLTKGQQEPECIPQRGAL